jgi:hypothetical protein
MPRGSNRGGRNNNPTGRNQYSDWGVAELVRERPFAAAAAAAGAAAAGLFLWSKRTQISEQLSNLSDQIGEWTDNMSFGNGASTALDDTAGLTMTDSTGNRSGAGSRSASGTRSASRSSSGSRARNSSGKSRGMSETGGGNASLGGHSGGNGTGGGNS